MNPPTGPSIRVFISHSTDDRALALRLAKCIEACVPATRGLVRCTSEPQYGLEAGSQLSEALALDLEATTVVIGLLTKQALASQWVLLELGFAWVARKLLLLLAEGITVDAVPEPLRDRVLKDLANPAELASFMVTLATRLGAPLAPETDVQRAIDALLAPLPRSLDPRRFFGLDHARTETDIRIVLQGDAVTNVLAEPPYGNKDLADALAQHAEGRLFKARQWINQWDARGALEILSCLHGFGSRTPVVRALARNESAGDQKRGLIVTMGLGFTDSTLDVLALVSDRTWAQIDFGAGVGDCLLLHRAVADHFLAQDVERDFNPLPKESAWVTLVPRDWSLPKWLDPKQRRGMRDYAMILRHTDLGDNGKPALVKIACSGFTEYGTFIAGRYLATNWRKLAEDAASNDVEGRGLGDFLAIVAGPPQEQGWRCVAMITPKALAVLCAGGRLAPSEWSRRFVA